MTGTVDTGRYVLELGRPSGTLISSPAQPKDGHPRPLRRALEKGGDRRRGKKSAADPLANVVDIAAEATAKAERAVALFRALAEGSLDAKQLVGEIDALVALVERLDRDGHWQEALELARALSGLLALTIRWTELVRSLNIALRAAEKLEDPLAAAWAQHELGTLHLAAEDSAGAERMLGAARETRQRLDDRRGLSASNRNIEVLCQHLRQLLRSGRLVQRRPALRATLAVGVVLLLAGGVATAVVASGGAVEPPGTPLPGECDNKKDDDGDGLIDFGSDPGCASPNDGAERNAEPPEPPQPPEPTQPPEPPQPACSDQRDNDGDGLIDFRSDPGCTSPDDSDERDRDPPEPPEPPQPACSDELDNDGDKLVDLGSDPGCTSADDEDETDPADDEDETDPGDDEDETDPADDGETDSDID